MNELSLFNELFDGLTDEGYMMPSFSLKKVYSPKADVIAKKDSYTLEMDLPGKSEKDISIELDRNVLTISSVKEESTQTESKTEDADKSETPKEAAKYLLRERSICSFTRSFTLPEDVDGEKISAKVNNGILSVTMPRKPLSSPKRISISVA